MANIALIDDHPIVRRGFKQLIETVSLHRIAVEHGTGAGLLADPRLSACELLVLDLSLPDMHGFEVLREVRNRPQPPAVLVLSMHDEMPFVREALDLGAQGYLSKGGAEDELLDAIDALLAGRQYLGREVQSRIEALDPRRDAVFPELSARESQVARLLIEGCDPVEIAQRLGMARKTTYAHRTRVLEKLNIRNEAELVALAHERGYAEGIGTRESTKPLPPAPV